MTITGEKLTHEQAIRFSIVITKAELASLPKEIIAMLEKETLVSARIFALSVAAGCIEEMEIK